MANSGILWKRWCRICANENTDKSYYIHFESSINDQEPPNIWEQQFTVKESLEMFLYLKPNDVLPRYMCVDCYNRLSDMLVFQEHCKNVQQMYRHLVKNPVQGACDLRAMRTKFQVGIKNLTTRSHGGCNDTAKTDQNNIRDIEERIADNINVVEDCSVNSDNRECGNKNAEELILEDTSVVLEDMSDTMSEHLIWQDDDDKSISNNSEPGDTPSSQPVLSSNNNDTQNVEGISFCPDFALDVACTVCKQTFSLYHSYCKHMASSHANIENYCPLCKRFLKTSFHLGKHMRTHMPLEIRFPFKCEECDSRHTTSTKLEEHIILKHKKEKRFKCELCSYYGLTKNAVRQHKLVHSNDAPFECQICKKKFKKLRRLNLHLDTHGPKKYDCTVCGQKLNSMVTLRQHSLVHTEQKDHKCDYCGSFFKRSKSLKNHLLLHMGLKPYICNFCELAFGNPQQCRNHMTKEHPKEFTATVESGNKAYTRNVPTLEKLKEVTKTSDNLMPVFPNGRRTGETSFECQYCKCPFSYYSTLRYHVKTKHPNELADFLQMSSGKTSNSKTKD